jgi:hypothetical protein
MNEKYKYTHTHTHTHTHTPSPCTVMKNATVERLAASEEKCLALMIHTWLISGYIILIVFFVL